MAIEQGIPFRVEQDGLTLDVSAIDAFLDVVEHATAAADPLLLRIAAIPEPTEAGPPPMLLSWAAGWSTLEGLRAAIDRARGRPSSSLRDRRRARARDRAWHQGSGVRPCRGGGHGRGRLPKRPVHHGGPGPARALDEERRLAYVAWTRARQELVLVYDPDAPSIFMREAFSPTELRRA